MTKPTASVVAIRHFAGRCLFLCWVAGLWMCSDPKPPPSGPPVPWPLPTTETTQGPGTGSSASSEESITDQLPTEVPTVSTSSGTPPSMPPTQPPSGGALLPAPKPFPGASDLGVGLSPQPKVPPAFGDRKLHLTQGLLTELHLKVPPGAGERSLRVEPDPYDNLEVSLAMLRLGEVDQNGDDRIVVHVLPKAPGRFPVKLFLGASPDPVADWDVEVHPPSNSERAAVGRLVRHLQKQLPSIDKVRKELRAQLDIGAVYLTPKGVDKLKVVTGLVKEWDASRLQELGSGTFGTVYGYSTLGGKRYALKKMIKMDLQALAAEVAPVHVVGDHPTLVRYYGCFKKDGHWYIVLDLAQGSLHELLRKKLSKDTRKRIYRQALQDIAAGLGVLHGHGLAHSDLKPGNILYDKDAKGYRFYLADFGGVISDRQGHSYRQYTKSYFPASDRQCIAATKSVFGFRRLLGQKYRTSFEQRLQQLAPNMTADPCMTYLLRWYGELTRDVQLYGRFVRDYDIRKVDSYAFSRILLELYLKRQLNWSSSQSRKLAEGKSVDEVLKAVQAKVGTVDPSFGQLWRLTAAPNPLQRGLFGRVKQLLPP